MLNYDHISKKSKIVCYNLNNTLTCSVLLDVLQCSTRGICYSNISVHNYSSTALVTTAAAVDFTEIVVPDLQEYTDLYYDVIIMQYLNSYKIINLIFF